MSAKRLLMAIALLFAISTGADAQGILKRIKDKAVDAAKRKIENKVERETEDAMDEVLDGKKKGKKSKDGDDTDVGDEENGNVAEDGQIDFAQIQAKSDFKRGGTVFFNDDLSGEQMGEFPSKWDLLEGSECEVVSIKGKKAIKIEETKIKPLMKDLKYLPEEFTIDDVMRCFGLSVESSKVRISRLQKDHLIEKIGEFKENGTTKAKYKKAPCILL